MIIRRRLLSLALALPLLAACSSSSAPPPEAQGPMRGSRMMGGGDASPLSLPARWWHDVRVAKPLQLTGEQLARLDALAQQQADLSSLERDSMMAMRELRTSLDASNTTAAEIIAGGSHLRDMRRDLLERQIALLAAQREILTIDQWKNLQRQLTEERRPTRPQGMRGGPGRGGPGGRGGGRGGWQQPDWD